MPGDRTGPFWRLLFPKLGVFHFGETGGTILVGPTCPAAEKFYAHTGGDERDKKKNAFNWATTEIIYK